MSTYDLYISGYSSPANYACVRDDTYVYFVNNNNRIGRVSISNPNDISLNWVTVTTLSQINSMAIYGTTIYCAQHLKITVVYGEMSYLLNQVNTTNATFTGYSFYSANTLQGFSSITCDKNGTIYVVQKTVASGSGVIYKLGTQRTVTPWIDNANYAIVHSITYYNEYIYVHITNVSTSYDGIHRYPISTPNHSNGWIISPSPFFPQSKFPTNVTSNGLAAYNDFLYLAMLKIARISISNPTVYNNDFANAGTGINGQPAQMCTSTTDNYMFIGTGSALCKISLMPIASSLYYGFSGTTTSLQLYNKYLYTHTGNNIIRLHKTNRNDVSLNWVSLPFQNNTIISNGYIYSVSPTTITIIQISNKSTTTINISLANTSQIIYSAYVNYPYIYFSNETYIARLNLITPTDVNYIWCSLGFTAYTMIIYNNYLYAGKSNTNPIQKIDISNPAIITTFVSSNATTNDYKGFSIYNNYLYVSLQNSGVIARYALSNSSINNNPYANFTVNPYPSGTAASYDGRLFVSGNSGNIYSVSIPSFVTSTVYPPTLVQSNTIAYGSGIINVVFTDISNSWTNDINYVYYLFDPSSGVNQFANISYYTDTGIHLLENKTQYSFLISGLTTKTYTIYLRAVNNLNHSSNSSPYSISVLTTPFSPNSYSLSFDELNGITVSITDTSNVAINQVYYHYYYYREGDTTPNQSTDISVYANTYVPVVNGQTTYSFTIKGLQTSYYNVYIATKNTVGSTIYSPVIAPVNVICFKEDSRILTNRGYRKIQYLKRGDLVKTFNDGFKPIYKIGKKYIVHVPSCNRAKERLYKCSPDKYPEVFEDLVLTGCHSILVDEFVDDEQRNRTQQINGGIYVTDKKYRLPVCADERATVYEHAGNYAVYHIALENDDYYMNYGIYANGLLVESTSKRFLDEYKVMETIDNNLRWCEKT